MGKSLQSPAHLGQASGIVNNVNLERLPALLGLWVAYLIPTPDPGKEGDLTKRTLVTYANDLMLEESSDLWASALAMLSVDDR